MPEAGRPIGVMGGPIVVLRMLVRGVAIAAGALFVGVLGVMMRSSSAGVTTAVVMRSVLAIALLLAMTRAFRIRDRTASDHAGRPYPHVLVAATLGYLVDPFSWRGQTLFGQLLLPVGVLSAVIDLIFWMAIAVAGVLLAEHARVQAISEPIPYA